MREDEEYGAYNFRSLDGQQISDNEGRAYRLSLNTDDATYVWITLWFEDWSVAARVGVSKWLIRSAEILELADIILYNPPSLSGKGLLRLLPYRLLRHIRPLSFRHKGLGSVMLRTMIEEAEHQGFQKIIAYAVSSDTPFEQLLPWYAKHGFCIPEPPYNQHLTPRGILIVNHLNHSDHRES